MSWIGFSIRVYKWKLPSQSWCQALHISSFITCCDRVSFSTNMPFVSADPDCTRRQRELLSGGIEKSMCSAFIAYKIKSYLDASICRLSTNVVDLIQFVLEKKHGDNMLGMTACVFAKDMTIQSGNWLILRTYSVLLCATLSITQENTLIIA